MRATGSTGAQPPDARDRVLKIIQREKARTDRTDCAFCVVLFSCDHSERDGAPSQRLADAVRRRARVTDEIEFFGPFVCAILIATPGAGAHLFAQCVAERTGPEITGVTYSVFEYPSPAVAPVGGANGRDHASGTHSDGDSNGNGHTNGHGSANGDGHLSGHLNGHLNGHANGHANGSHNGRARHNGSPSNGRGVTNGQTTVAQRGIGTASATLPLMLGLGRLTSQDFAAANPVNGPLQLMFVQPLPLWKRSTDLVGASLGILLLAPLIAVIAAAIKIASPGPVIFKQVRAGKAGRPFVLYKFRSMRVDAESMQQTLRKYSVQDGPAFKLKTDPRATRLGHVLRKTSLDELPQLWNVLKGDMSLVGPRPLPWQEACGCAPWQRRRLDVTPGITCIWQVQGRSRVTFADWMRMDIAYTRTRGFTSDLRLLLATIPAVVFRRGAS